MSTAVLAMGSDHGHSWARPTAACIDLGAIRRNAGRIRRAVGPGVRLYAVVKADAYGHGAAAVGRVLAGACDALAVSTVEEALALRQAGLAPPVLVLADRYDGCSDEILLPDLIFVAHDEADIEGLAAAARRRGGEARVHLKVDTGMGRLGFPARRLPVVLERGRRLRGLRVDGLCTHIGSADAADPRPTLEQLRRFEEARAIAGPGPVAHAANSVAALRFPEARLDAVRPGLALYGGLPAGAIPGGTVLEPALSLRTRVMAVRELRPGDTVGYGATWTARRPSRIATLPIGYADGYPRQVAGAAVLLRGRRAPVVGRVCMQMTMIDVTDVPGATPGDAVTLIGADGPQRIRAAEVAAWAGTISHDILCGISPRVPRVYVEPRRRRPEVDRPGQVFAA